MDAEREAARFVNTCHEAEEMATLLRDLLPMVEDWADGGDDEGAEDAARRIRAILERIDGR